MYLNKVIIFKKSITLFSITFANLEKFVDAARKLNLTPIDPVGVYDLLDQVTRREWQEKHHINRFWLVAELLLGPEAVAYPRFREDIAGSGGVHLYLVAQVADIDP